MESKKMKVTKAMGIVIAVCAVGILIVKYFTNGNLDSYIPALILLFVAVVIYFQKPKETSVQIEISPMARKVVFSLLTVTLVAGLIAFLVTLL